MGTELTAQTLTVSITETIAVDHANGTTNDIDFAQTYTHTYGSIANVSKRIIKLANTNLTEVATFGTDTQNGAFVRADVRYIRVTNLDDTDALQVGLDDEDSDAAYTSVAADSSIIFTGTTVEGGNGGSTLDNATALKVKGSANQQLEVMIASV
jgi:hypothetical protein|tara:strand:- start:516 stop:977 length:462 start_codon:yes stop_codon:yes gene_type:complete